MLNDKEAVMHSRCWMVGIALAVLALAVAPGLAQATDLEDQIEDSIAGGLAWLAAQQHPDGSWGGDLCDRVAVTGLAVLKFETRAIELGLDPTGVEYEYAAQVRNGLTFITANAQTVAIGMQPAGNPDSDGDGIGVYFAPLGCEFHQVYNTGIAMMALAASGHPELYRPMLQDSVDFMAWAQADVGCGAHRGGWRYFGNVCDSDNSNSGYATLGQGYAAAAAPWGFGLTIPPFVKSELSLWIDVIQDDVNGDPDDGGSWYDPSWPWVNILKTGNLIYEMGLVGDTPDTQRVKDAVDYIERHWYDAGGGNVGWRDHRQAMFAMMKGLEALGIEKLDLDGDGTAETSWFDEVAQHLIATQNPDGSWPWDPWADQVLSTAWALLTLEKAVPALVVPVSVDIKPGSCPNPLNVKEKGVLPVAVLGTEDFDVTRIDPSTVGLSREGVVGPDGNPVVVPVLRWSYEDVATPYAGDPCGCHALWGDGYTDLTLKFDAQLVVENLGLAGIPDRTTLPLLLSGNLKGEGAESGPPIQGQDCLRVQVKTK